MFEPFTTATSVLALLVSAATAWLTLFRRGKVQMTQPTVIFLGPDGGRPPYRGPKPKVFLRTLLFSPAKRGSLVECMYVRLARDDVSQNFSVWVYGEERLARGSGLFVPETGVTTNHHFLLPEEETNFNFEAGSYELQVFTRLVGRKDHDRLLVQSLEVSEPAAISIAAGAGIYFDWSPDHNAYVAHVELPVSKESLSDVLTRTRSRPYG
jgi:hypothetical protein